MATTNLNISVIDKRMMKQSEAASYSGLPVATTLREAGLDERRIADLLGQKPPSMARHYSRSVNLAEKNRQTMKMLEKENERRAKIVKPSPKSVKPDQSEDQR